MDTNDPPGHAEDPVIPETTQIGRVTLRVGDLDEVVAFYRDVLGLRLRDRVDGTASLGTETDTLLELVHDPDAPERAPDDAGLFHVAFRLPTRAALGAALERLSSKWELTGASDHVVSEAIYCRDPEGNGVEIYWDTPPETWPREGDGVGIDTLPLNLEDLADAAPDGGMGTDEYVPEGADVGHVHIEATDLARAEAVYAGALGLTVTQRYADSGLFLAAGGYHHHLGINVWNGRTRPKPSESRGLDAFEVVVPDAATVEAVAERLAAVGGVEFDEEGPGEGFVVTDPDGIRVRIVVTD